MRKIYLHYRPEIRRYSFWLALSITGLIASVAIEVLFPFLFGKFSEAITNEVNDEAIAQIKTLLLLFLVAYTAIWITRRIHDFSIVIYEARSMRDLEKRIFQHVQIQSARFYENNFTGSIVKKSGRFIRAFEMITDTLLFVFLNRLLQITIMLGIFFSLAPGFALAFLVWTIIFVGGNVWFSVWKLKYDKAVAVADSRIGAIYTDSLGNHQTVRTFSREQEEYGLISNATDSLFSIRLRTWTLNMVAYAVQGFLMLSLEFVLVFYMAEKWKAGVFSVEDYVVFQTFLLFLFAGLWDLGRQMRNFFTAYADANEMIEILEQIPEVQDKPVAKPIEVKSGAIDFQHVTFAYEQGQDKLKDFTLKIPAGQRLAVVGHTGAGKTTITKILLRLFDIQKGAILIDDQNIADVTLASLRQNITLVPQQPELFHRTIRQNILIGKPDADDSEVIEAARKAQALEFIERLPKKFETIVGERGIKLSGGEKQRIAIARAFLENASILILDEATSALDSITEKKVQQAVMELLKNRTSIVIAHRLSTILKMDRIIVMENGKITEDGSHQDLLKQNGQYASMWDHQAGGFLKE